MKSLCKLVVLVNIALFLGVNSSAQQSGTNRARDFQTDTKKSANMKDYVLLVRFSTKKALNPEQLKLITEQWTTLIERWTKQGNFVASSVIPQEGVVISGAEKKLLKGFAVTADSFKVVSIIHLRASNIEEAVELAKASPNLDLGGTVEVREIQPNPQSK